MTETTRDVATAESAWQAWHAERDADLARPYDWLSVVAFHWTTAEAQDEPDAVVPGVPGRWWTAGGLLHVRADAAEGLAILPEGELDGDGHVLDGVTTVEVAEGRGARWGTFGGDGGEAVLIEVLLRGGYYALRLRDPAAPARLEFAGVPTYAYDPAWVVEVELEPYPEARTVLVGAAAPGLEHEVRAVGEVVLRLDGSEQRLVATGHGERWSVSFSDATSGVTSSAWRAVGVDGQPHSGRGIVDFNRAVNFPCAFTDFGTCPRPIAGNHLDLEVRAGEKAPAGRAGEVATEDSPTALPGLRARI